MLWEVSRFSGGKPPTTQWGGRVTAGGSAQRWRRQGPVMANVVPGL